MDGVVDIPNTTERISAGAFQNNRNITEIKFSQGILGDLDIGANAFSGCQKLATISLPTGLTTMKTGMFKGCASLVTINVPNTVNKMEVDIFVGCTNLANIVFDEGNESNILVMDDGEYSSDNDSGWTTSTLSSVFNGVTKLDVVVLPSGCRGSPHTCFLTCTHRERLCCPVLCRK